MEPVHKTLLHTKPEIKDTFALPKDRQRFLWYTHKLDRTEWTIVSYSEFDEKLIYSETDIALKMGATNLYPQRTKRRGFTLDKEKKKLQFWYLTQPKDFQYLHLLFEELGKEWVINENFLGRQEYRSGRHGKPATTIYHGWLTKGLLEKILLGKITNPTDAAKYIIKANRLKDATPKYLREFIKAENSKQMLLLWNGHVTRIDDVIVGGVVGRSTTREDLLTQAKALGRVIDLKWSNNRMQEVHKQWTREMMELELALLDEEVVPYSESFDFLPPSIELIRDRKRLFVEGKTMDHCVYTNYWDSVSNRQYMVWHVEQENGEPITAGIRITYDKYYLDQAYGRRNQVTPSEKTKQLLENVLSSFQFKSAMIREFWPHKIDSQKGLLLHEFDPYKNGSDGRVVYNGGGFGNEDDLPY